MTEQDEKTKYPIVYVRGYGTDRPETFVRSDAVFQILKDVGGFWTFVSWARIAPGPVRDLVYDMVARRRYRWRRRGHQ